MTSNNSSSQDGSHKNEPLKLTPFEAGILGFGSIDPHDGILMPDEKLCDVQGAQKHSAYPNQKNMRLLRSSTKIRQVLVDQRNKMQELTPVIEKRNKGLWPLALTLSAMQMHVVAVPLLITSLIVHHTNKKAAKYHDKKIEGYLNAVDICVSSDAQAEDKKSAYEKLFKASSYVENVERFKPNWKTVTQNAASIFPLTRKAFRLLRSAVKVVAPKPRKNETTASEKLEGAINQMRKSLDLSWAGHSKKETLLDKFKASKPAQYISKHANKLNKHIND